MVSKAERELIVDYALQNESNMEIALKVGAAFNEIRKRITADFLDTLEGALKGDLQNYGIDGEWIIKKGTPESYNIFWPEFSITKKQWKDKYFIRVAARKSGLNDFIIGVVKDQKILPIDGGRLKDLLDKQFDRLGKGRADNWWEWWQFVDEPYRNWDNEEVFIKMKFEKDEFVNYFKEQILAIVRIATPVIDKAVKSM